MTLRLGPSKSSCEAKTATSQGIIVRRQLYFATFKDWAHGDLSVIQQWPSSHFIEDANTPSQNEWGIYTQGKNHRKITEKWRVRGGWSLTTSQVKGPVCETALKIEQAGTAHLSINASGSHWAISMHKHRLLYWSNGPSPNPTEQSITTSGLVWENTVDYHTASLKIPREMDEIDLNDHSETLIEKRRPTIAGTRPFSSDQRKTWSAHYHCVQD